MNDTYGGHGPFGRRSNVELLPYAVDAVTQLPRTAEPDLTRDIAALVANAHKDMLLSGSTPIEFTQVARDDDALAVVAMEFVVLPQFARPLNEEARYGNPGLELLVLTIHAALVHERIREGQAALYRTGPNSLTLVLRSAAAARMRQVRYEALMRFSAHKMPGAGIPYRVSVGSMALYTALYHVGMFYRWIGQEFRSDQDLAAEILAMWQCFTVERARSTLAREHGIQLTQTVARPNVWYNLCTYDVRWQAFLRTSVPELEQCSDGAREALVNEGLPKALKYWDHLYRQALTLSWEELDTQLRQPGDDLHLARLVYVLQVVYPWLLNER